MRLPGSPILIFHGTREEEQDINFAPSSFTFHLTSRVVQILTSQMSTRHIFVAVERVCGRFFLPFLFEYT